MRPIKKDALTNDSRLLEMAVYEATKGQTVDCDKQALLAAFKNYKRILKQGDATIDSLEDQVFSRFGIVAKKAVRDTNLIDAGHAPANDRAEFYRNLLHSTRGLSYMDSPTPEYQDEEDESLYDGLQDLEQDILDEDFPEDDGESGDEDETDE